MFVGARRAGLSILKTANLLGFSQTTISRVYRECPKKRKYPVSGNGPVDAKGECPGWFELIDSLQPRNAEEHQ